MKESLTAFGVVPRVWRGLDPDAAGWVRLEEGARRLRLKPGALRTLAARGAIRRRIMWKGCVPRVCVNVLDLWPYVGLSEGSAEAGR
jgi:hypothetical protein